jgi:hypothetical protein
MLEPTSLIFLRIAMMNPKNNPCNHCGFVIVSDNCATLVVTNQGLLLFSIIASH